MDQETFNVGLRKFLKQVGVTSQRELELAVGRALGDGRLKGNETLRARMVLTVDGLDLTHEVTADIALE
ncbi:DUF6494 family protein [Azospirillum sp. TSO35-2]|uniref:DUF6494 family protein n=1 Tax=Azospirillum sp. TSO35-2 TaxID=716796 RepID=UPI000D605609|nr:DUF6494 family protein [Azospirillum sp. TSO35-2]PWC33167.1 hypothetical protein TSO352_21805 [Azospirillum sp. TSO35-2]